MSRLSLSLFSGMNDRAEPRFDSSVVVEGTELIATRSDASETFRRQINFRDSDVSEISLSSSPIARERGMTRKIEDLFAPSRLDLRVYR